VRGSGGARRFTAARPRRDRLGGPLEQRPFGDGKAFKLCVEGLVGRSECAEKGPPVLLIPPAVDRQVPVASGSVVVQLGTEEPRGPGEQLAPDAVWCVGRGERRCPVIEHLVLPHPHEHASIRPQTPPPARPNGAERKPLPTPACRGRASGQPRGPIPRCAADAATSNHARPSGAYTPPRDGRQSRRVTDLESICCDRSLTRCERLQPPVIVLPDPCHPVGRSVGGHADDTRFGPLISGLIGPG